MVTATTEFCYLDHAATTPMRREAIEAMLPFFGESSANPSGAHRGARSARRALDDARDTIAGLLGVSGDEIVFTSGGSEADNLAILGYQGFREGLVVSAIEHRAVLVPATARGAKLAPVTSDGVVDLDALSEMLDDSTGLVSIMAVNNEVGVVQPLSEVVNLVRRLAPAALIHTDAVQAFPWCDLVPLVEGCDLISISAHKFGGPKGTGALAIRKRARSAIKPLLLGGSQEGDLRAGTQNVAGAVAMAVAAKLTADEREATASRVARLRDRLEDGLIAAIAGLSATAPRALRVAGSCPIRVAGINGDELLMLVDAGGVAVSLGSSCASGAREPSHVLAAMGLTRADARGAVRLSLGATTTTGEIEHALDVIPAAVRQLRPHDKLGD